MPCSSGVTVPWCGPSPSWTPRPPPVPWTSVPAVPPTLSSLWEWPSLPPKATVISRWGRWWTFDIYLKLVMKILCKKTPVCLKINIFHFLNRTNECYPIAQLNENVSYGWENLTSRVFQKYFTTWKRSKSYLIEISSINYLSRRIPSFYQQWKCPRYRDPQGFHHFDVLLWRI